MPGEWDIGIMMGPTAPPICPYIQGSVQDATDLLIPAYLARNGTLLYIGAANKLTVVSVTSPSSPTIVGTIDDSPLDTGPLGIAYADGVAYVCCPGDDSFISVDVSSPGSMSILDTIQDTSLFAFARNVIVSGSIAWVLREFGSKLIPVDISNPSAMSVIGTPATISAISGARDLVKDGSFIYTISPSGPDNNGTLVALDVSTPSTPTVVDDLRNLGSMYALVKVGSLIYAVGLGATLKVFDVSTPSSLTQVGSFSDTLTNLALGIAYDGDFLFVPNVDSPGSLTVLDITSPTSPVIAAGGTGFVTDSQLNGAFRVVNNGGIVYVTAIDDNRLVVVNTTCL